MQKEVQTKDLLDHLFNTGSESVSVFVPNIVRCLHKESVKNVGGKKSSVKRASRMFMVHLNALTDLEDPSTFQANSWGILEPVASPPALSESLQGFPLQYCASALSTERGEKVIDLVIVPGVAFDQTSNRLGHGKGYYDQFLSSLQSHRKALGLPAATTIVSLPLVLFS